MCGILIEKLVSSAPMERQIISLFIEISQYFMSLWFYHIEISYSLPIFTKIFGLFCWLLSIDIA